MVKIGQKSIFRSILDKNVLISDEFPFFGPNDYFKIVPTPKICYLARIFFKNPIVYTDI